MPGCAARLREELVAPAHEWEEPCAARIQESLLHSRLVGDGAGGGIAHSHDFAQHLLELGVRIEGLALLDANGGQHAQDFCAGGLVRLGLDDFIDVSEKNCSRSCQWY